MSSLRYCYHHFCMRMLFPSKTKGLEQRHFKIYLWIVIFFTFVLWFQAGLKSLQALVNSLEKKIDETEKRFEETSKVSEERLKQALDAESKMIELKTTMQRFFSVIESYPLN